MSAGSVELVECKMSDAVDREQRRQSLSAMMDGELGSADVARLCRDWRDDGELRVTWHAYHLIGDVMRSEDLAQDARHDEAFLQALRRRLADEPVVMAPAATIAASAPARRRRWLAPAAVAAGFVAVAGVMVVTRLAAPGGEAPAAVIASQPAPAGAAMRVSNVASGVAVVPAAGVDGVLIRDAQLDRYLQAHKQYGPSAVLVPGGVVRSTASAVPQR